MKKQTMTLLKRTMPKQLGTMSKLTMSGIIVLLGLALLATATHLSPPPLENYQQYYGQITGLPAGTTGLQLKAVVDGSEYTTPIDAQGRYGYSPTFKVTGEPGELITFFIVKQIAQTKVGETTFDPTVPVVELNFLAPPTLTGPLDFTLTNGGNKGLLRGEAVTTNVTATLTSGLPEPVNFSVSGLPAGITAAFNASSCTPTCVVSLTLSSTPEAAVGVATITVTSSGGGTTKTTSFSLTVAAPGPLGFTLANDGNKNVLAGKDVDVVITVGYLSGTTQPVTFTTPGLPTGIKSSFSAASCLPPCSTKLELDTSSSLSAGLYPLMVQGTGGGLTLQTTFTLNVTPRIPLGFALSTQGNKSVAAGSTITNEITATYLNGTSQVVSFTVSGLPSGATSSFSRTGCTPNCTTALTIVTSTSAVVGIHNVSVAGVAGDNAAKSIFHLTITGAPTTTCTQNWQCGEWSACVNNLQARSCYDLNKCEQAAATVTKIPSPKPEEQRICQAPPPIVPPLTLPPALCSPTTKQCLGNVLQQCSYDGRSWTTLESCSNGCDPLALSCKGLPPKPQKPLLAFPSWLLYTLAALAAGVVIIVVAVGLLGRKKLAPARTYIQESRAKGYSDQQIRGRLVGEGWEAKKIDRLLK